MQRLEVSGAVRPIYGSLGVKRLTVNLTKIVRFFNRQMIPSCYNGKYILVLTTLKMAT